MADFDLSRITDANGDNWNIKAKGLESQISIGADENGDVTGSTTSDLTGSVAVTLTIGAGKVTTTKIDDEAVTNVKIKDSTITLQKFAESVTSGGISDNDSKLATHSQVKSYVDSAVLSNGSYLGRKSVATINTWVAANLNNGDHCIVDGDGTITLGNLSVRDGEDIIFYKNGTGSSLVAKWESMDGDFKLKQTAISDPTSNGSSLSFIDSISQNTNGEITATKKAVQNATTSQKGVVKVGTGLSVSEGTLSVSYGNTSTTACKGDDERLSNARTPTSHSHGNITNEGKLQTTADVTIASGDKLVVTDGSNESKVARTNVTFDGSTTTTALTPKGTFESFAKSSDISSAIEELDAEKTSNDSTHIAVKVTQVDGKIDSVSISTDNTEANTNKVKSWSSTPNDTNYPSEKLVKDSLDEKEGTFTINYDSASKALVFSKAFGSTT